MRMTAWSVSIVKKMVKCHGRSEEKGRNEMVTSASNPSPTHGFRACRTRNQAMPPHDIMTSRQRNQENSRCAAQLKAAVEQLW